MVQLAEGDIIKVLGDRYQVIRLDARDEAAYGLTKTTAGGRAKKLQFEQTVQVGSGRYQVGQDLFGAIELIAL